MDTEGTFKDLSPLSLLEQLDTFEANGYLQAFSGSVAWGIYFADGKIIYASHSVAPFERLDRHLRSLGHKISEVLKETYAEVRSHLEASNDDRLSKELDYQTLCSLLNKHYLTPVQTAELIDDLAKEVIESLFWANEGNFKFFNQHIDLPLLSRVDIKFLSEYCQRRLIAWQSLEPEIWSPYQRPYFFGHHHNNSEASEENQKRQALIEKKLGTLLKGFSFRQLSVLMKQDEIKLIQWLRPYILDKTILLREPQSPFDQLPKLPKFSIQKVSRQFTSIKTQNITNREISLGEGNPVGNIREKYKVVCVDDSPTILNEISRFLDSKSFDVFKITDPLKALMQIVRIKPDIILLDVGMPNINGYELCSLIRNNAMFKNTPIVMVTGNTGIIDRAKAKMVGASGYLTKPFNQSELLKIVFKHIA